VTVGGTGGSRGQCIGQHPLNCVPFSSAGLGPKIGNLMTEFGRTNVYSYPGGVY